MQQLESFLQSVARHPVGFWVLVIGGTVAIWAVIGLGLWWLGRVAARRGGASFLSEERDPASLAEPAVPDPPQGFGYKISWLALRATSPQQVAEWLGMRELRPANWRQGIQAAYAYNSTVFVTPAVRGWVFVVASELPWLATLNYGGMNRILADASSPDVFGEAQAFGSHRVSNFLAWFRAENGELRRAFVAADHECLYEAGPVTEDERALGFAIDADGLVEADEETVVQLAGRWSVNPEELKALDVPPATGLVGRLPETRSAPDEA